MNDLSAFQRDLLYVVAGLGRPHGLAIKSELETYYRSDINQGRLYPNLDSLVDLGLIEKGQKDRRTNYYTLTSHGVDVIDSRREWEESYLGKMDPQRRVA